MVPHFTKCGFACMSKRHKVKKGIKKVLAEYAFHLWILFFLVNAAVLFTVRYYTTAAPSNTQTESDLLADVIAQPTAAWPTPEPTVLEPTATPVPVGPFINLSFSMPGVGSNAGNMTPIHLKREVILYFYKADDNSANPKTKPLYTVKATAVFNIDNNTADYTAFVTEPIDVGLAGVKEGDYQIVLRADQTLRKIIKTREQDASGKLFKVLSGQDFTIPHQSMVTGDIYPPDGDNALDINDYNSFVSCFGDRSLKSSCPNRLLADLDDNGVVDGLDYNLMLISYRQLVSQGFPVVRLPTPTSTILQSLPKTTPQTQNNTKKPQTDTKKPSSAPEAKVAASNNSGMMTILLTVLGILLLAGGTAFFIFKTKLLNKLKPQPAQTPDEQGASEEAPAATEEAGAEPAAPETQTDTAQQPAESTPASEASPAAPTPAAVPTGTEGEVIEGEYMVKLKSKDDAKKGVWLSLTGDHGVLEGYYQAETVTEGFATIKGVMKKEGDKSYVEISELTPAA